MNELYEFRDLHVGPYDNTCIVLGCGPSIDNFDFDKINHIYSIGVNDIVQKYIPDYLVISDNMYSVKKDIEMEKRGRILNNRSSFTFSYYNLPFKNSIQINYEFISHNMYSIEQILLKNRLVSCVTTTEVAISLAIYMGFSSIGIIGWDLTNLDIAHTNIINYYGMLLHNYATRNGIDIYNLSKISLIDSLFKISVEDFLNGIP